MSVLADVRRCERGELSLPGLMVAIVLMLLIMGATLDTFGSFAHNRQELEVRNDMQDRARTAVDRLARELRNLASPTPSQPQAIDQAGPFDLVFKTVDPNPSSGGLNSSNIKRMRYCLDSRVPSAATVVVQSQTWRTADPPAVPSTTACPGSGWESTEILASAVTNRAGGQSRAVFEFDSAVLTDIESVRVNLFTDLDVARLPRETQISSGVFLRNQNRKPVASFTATPSGQGIVLNGSASQDPEGEPLRYVWYDGTKKIEEGSGITFLYAVEPGTVHNIHLRVYDPASLEGISPVQEVIA